MAKKVFGLFLLIALIMTGCSLGGREVTDGVEVGFNFTMPSVKSQLAVTKSALSRCIVNLVGRLTVYDHETGLETEYSWFGDLNCSTFDIESNKTIILKPGTYDFTMELTIDSFNYVGSVEGVIITDGENVIPMTIYSIIGEVDVDFDITQFASLRFYYPAAEFQNITTPRVGYIIDGGSEVILDFDKSTGITTTYLNLLPDEYNIQLKLYDGQTQIGKSVTEQEDVVVALKTNIVMDIVPLHVVTTFEFDQVGGTATFNFTVPDEVIAEVEGLENLYADFRLYSAINGYLNAELVLADTPEGYCGSVSFDGFEFDTVSFTISFIDTRDYEVIGAGGYDGIYLDSSAQDVTVQMDLLRRALISGHLQAVLGIHVVSEFDVPVNGAAVYINDDYKGLTGEAYPATGTEGFLKIYQNMGECVIKASKDGKYGTVTIDVDALQIENVEIVLDMDE